MKSLYIILLSAVLAAISPHKANASYIAFKLKPSSMLIAGNVRVNLNITNTGDEPAKLVWAEVRAGSCSTKSKTIDSVNIKETTSITMELPNRPETPGIYTAIITLHWADAKGYPFSALKSIPIITAIPNPIEDVITASLSRVEFQKKGKVDLVLSTNNNTPVNAKVTLHIPPELRCRITTFKTTIKPGTENKLSFDISRNFARPGSKYEIQAVTEYSINGQHRSVATQSLISIKRQSRPFSPKHKHWKILLITLTLLFVFLQFIPANTPYYKHASRLKPYFPFAILIGLFAFLLYHIQPGLIFSNTMAIGGDTPAHNYLASHFAEQFFGHGKIVSWSSGWWCGFPMFQFYFCLPYLMTAFLDLVLPFNVAFKLVSVAGIFGLPLAIYASGRIARIPKLTCSVLAIAVIPLLFDHFHTMWGVNIYSTFAGMIANSLSFPIMLLFIASASRDSSDSTFRLRTVVLLVMLMASHFFTLVIAGLSLTIVPFIKSRTGIRTAILVLAKEASLAFLLMGWWFLPLLTKHEYSMNFGTNWSFEFIAELSDWLKGYLPFLDNYDSLSVVLKRAIPLSLGCAAIGTIALSYVRKNAFMAAISQMLLVSLLLFYLGFEHISPIFQNIRFWPFLVCSILTLSAWLIAMLIQKLKAPELAVGILLILTIIYGVGQPTRSRPWYVPAWAEWNYEGLEAKVRWTVFRDLLIPNLTNTPGRLANDLHPDNDSMGSSRIFESIPHLIGKPILEGGLVNSAAGSMFSYYIQSETSLNCAGFPSIVKPTSFNFTNATKHLALFNVKHFIARSPQTQEALASSKNWRQLGECQGWDLYELTNHNENYVYTPNINPISVRLEKKEEAGLEWKEAGLEWIYNISAIDQPFILLRSGEEPPAECKTTITEQEFYKQLTTIKPNTTTLPKCSITNEEIYDNSIRFKTTGIGLPHIIKCTYYPNWKVKGAKKVYMVTPCFMLVYPDSNDVELYYGHTLSDYIGKALTLTGFCMLCGIIVIRRRKTRISKAK
ncbi:MAG: hypothetical protein KAH23_01860 [Kiritimatiellae bacterium]|nr:hypothetical protein [Kiritimatiellia bacterium]